MGGAVSGHRQVSCVENHMHDDVKFGVFYILYVLNVSQRSIWQTWPLRLCLCKVVKYEGVAL